MKHKFARIALVCWYATLMACASEDETTSSLVALAPLEDFVPLDERDDPLAKHRPSSVACNDLVGWYLEDEALEVDTGACNYLALGAPAGVSVPKGTRVTTRVSHFDLTANTEATAHMALLVNSTVLWEDTFEVPGPARVLELDFDLPMDVEAGDMVSVHLHNHGQNTYKFQALWAPESAVR